MPTMLIGGKTNGQGTPVRSKFEPGCTMEEPTRYFVPVSMVDERFLSKYPPVKLKPPKRERLINLDLRRDPDLN